MVHTSLNQLPKNVEATIFSVNAGKCLVERLASMGILKGKKITKPNNGNICPVYVRVGESKYGIGMGMAEKIIVKY